MPDRMRERLARGSRRLGRLARNALFDLRYGRFLGGTRPSSAEAIGGNAAANSDYGALSLIFAAVNADDKVIADIGAGRGRAANFIIDRFSPRKLILIEYDKSICEGLRGRLRRHSNVVVINDDFRNVDLEGVELIYIFNPFGDEIMKDFVERLPTSCQQVIYYNPAKLRHFPDREFTCTYLLKDHAEHHDCVLIRRRNAGASTRTREGLEMAAAPSARAGGPRVGERGARGR